MNLCGWSRRCWKDFDVFLEVESWWDWSSTDRSQYRCDRCDWSDWSRRRRDVSPFCAISIFVSNVSDCIDDSIGSCVAVWSLHNLSLNIRSWIFQEALLLCSNAVWCLIANRSNTKCDRLISAFHWRRRIKELLIEMTWAFNTRKINLTYLPTSRHMSYPLDSNRRLDSRWPRLFLSCCRWPVALMGGIEQMHMQRQSTKRSNNEIYCTLITKLITFNFN